MIACCSAFRVFACLTFPLRVPCGCGGQKLPVKGVTAWYDVCSDTCRAECGFELGM